MSFRILAFYPLLAIAANAAEVHVMISGGLTAAFQELTPEFERTTGNKLVASFGPSMGDAPVAIPARLARGEAADIVILARQALDNLVAAGKVVRGSETDLVRSEIGVAVKAGAPVPKIATPQELKQTLLAAKSIVYSDSASGVYVSTELFKVLGIPEVAVKARMIPVTPVAEIIAKGEAEIGFQQISELLPVAGAKVVGPIPKEVQRITVFSAGVATAAKSPDAARELIRFLQSPQASAVMQRSGVVPIAP